MVSDLRVSSLQCGLSRKLHSSFTPESYRLLYLRCSTLRWEGLNIRAETRDAQLIADKSQSVNLNRK